ncbi:MAG: hypothetical protein K2G07_05535 [Muribaculaceae bacterium]|nr:hypothetical protein [Muribaculaceae bacterium]
MAKKFTLTTTPRAAMPRSKRLRELGTGALTAGSASVTVNASGAPSSDTLEGHTHENKAALDRISDDRDGYS